jgi:hypothetical protein
VVPDKREAVLRQAQDFQVETEVMVAEFRSLEEEEVVEEEEELDPAESAALALMGTRRSSSSEEEAAAVTVAARTDRVVHRDITEATVEMEVLEAAAEQEERALAGMLPPLPEVEVRVVQEQPLPAERLSVGEERRAQTSYLQS